MATALTAALLTEQLKSKDVPGLADARQNIEAELVSRTGLAISVDDAPDLHHVGQVDDWYATCEWSDGGGHHPRSHGLLGGRSPTRRQGRGAS